MRIRLIESTLAQSALVLRNFCQFQIVQQTIHQTDDRAWSASPIRTWNTAFAFGDSDTKRSKARNTKGRT